jgi:hypothetical protein
VSESVALFVNGCFLGLPTGLPLVPASGLFLLPLGHPGPRLMGKVFSGVMGICREIKGIKGDLPGQKNKKKFALQMGVPTCYLVELPLFVRSYIFKLRYIGHALHL